MLACTNCASSIPYDPTTDRLPPWCPHCGADITYGNAKPAAASPPAPLNEALSHWNGGPRSDATAPDATASNEIALMPAPKAVPADEPRAPTVVPPSAMLETMPNSDEPPRTYGGLLKVALLLLVVSAGLAFNAMKNADDWLWPEITGALGIVLLVFWANGRKW